MGLRSTVRALSSSGSSPSAATKKYAPLPPNAPEPVILNLTHPSPVVAILTQAIDHTPLFQIDYTTALTITHLPTRSSIGTAHFSPDHKITLCQPSPSSNWSYKNTLTPPTWLKAFGGNALRWITLARNEYQATIFCQIVDGVQHPDDEDDVAVAVILDSKWEKGRVEFRKHMLKDEMDFLLLSAIADIDDMKGKIRRGEVRANSGATVVAKGGRSGEGRLNGYLEIADSAMTMRIENFCLRSDIRILYH